MLSVQIFAAYICLYLCALYIPRSFIVIFHMRVAQVIWQYIYINDIGSFIASFFFFFFLFLLYCSHLTNLGLDFLFPNKEGNWLMLGNKIYKS